MVVMVKKRRSKASVSCQHGGGVNWRFILQIAKEQLGLIVAGPNQRCVNGKEAAMAIHAEEETPQHRAFLAAMVMLKKRQPLMRFFLPWRYAKKRRSILAFLVVMKVVFVGK